MICRSETWLDPRLALGDSAIHGTGLFAAEALAEGEVVMVWGGTTYTRQQLEAGEVPPCSFSFIDEDLLLAGPADGLDYFVNHSCDPNAWMADEVTVIVRYPIPAGSEVTGDYALWETDGSSVIERCRCGSAACRGRVSGNDWKRPDLQDRYRGHFLPYIERRFEALDVSPAGAIQ